MKRAWSFPLLIALLLLGSLSYSACESGAEDVGPPIPQEELTQIITEALLLEPAGRELPPAYQDTAFQRVYKQLLGQRGYDLATFTESMKWIQEDPKRLQEVYKTVLEQLQELDKEVK